MKDGVYEIIDGKMVLATQAVKESDNSATFLEFGDVFETRIMPIKEACSKCDFWKYKFATVTVCQETQEEDARARGFTKIICPEQFLDA